MVQQQAASLAYKDAVSALGRPGGPSDSFDVHHEEAAVHSARAAHALESLSASTAPAPSISDSCPSSAFG